jgi:dihydrofolate reductase
LADRIKSPHRVVAFLRFVSDLRLVEHFHPSSLPGTASSPGKHDTTREVRTQCSVFIATSLDGFIARPDGRLDFVKPFEPSGEEHGYKAFFDSVDPILVGRKTYDVVLALPGWPYAGKRCIVLTSAPPAPKHREEFYRGDPVELVDLLSAGGVKRVYVDGGIVIQQFLRAGLVSDLTISVIPVLLGEGVPLFGKTERDVQLELVGSQSFTSGLVKIEYRVRGPG